MKKIISIVMALVMMMAICVPAFAEPVGDIDINTSTLKDTDGDNVGDTEAEDYTVTIPADTTIPWGKESTDVSYSVESHLKRDHRVKVTVTGNGVMATADGEYTLAYTLTGADFQGDVPTIYPAATQTVTVDVTLDDWNTAVVEEYKDVLTYSAEIVTV